MPANGTHDARIDVWLNRNEIVTEGYHSSASFLVLLLVRKYTISLLYGRGIVRGRSAGSFGHGNQTGAEAGSHVLALIAMADYVD